ncbi:MAG: bifunctional adenosylcobinamide kinase/adenosylcobinamide-phosphate guanylyltransferase [Chloroflexota bacterium]
MSSKQAHSQDTRSTLVLITGGVRSGKSGLAERYATRLARRRGRQDRPPATGSATGANQGDDVLYVATAQVRDEEMAARVARHRADRPATWRTVEAPLKLGATLATALAGDRVVLVDSVDSWVSNRLLDANPASGEQLDSQRFAALETALLDEVQAIVAAQRSNGAPLILVSLEAGMGVIPPYPLGRAFRDLLGWVNAAFATAADEVYLLVAGLPVEVKRLSAQTVQDLARD